MDEHAVGLLASGQMSRKKESIVIVGLGGIGFYLAKWLAHEGYAITAIESRAEMISRADGEIDARLIRADAMSFSCWKQIQGSRIDYVIAVTDNDAVNITACLIADKCGARRTIARVRNLELWSRDALLTPEDLKINHLIRPSELCALEIARLLKMRSGDVVIDVDEDMQVVATHVTADSVLAGKTLKDISRDYAAFDYRIVSIARGLDTIIPSGDQVVQPNDHVFILTQRRAQQQLSKLLGLRKQGKHRVLILGGGLIGQRVAELLQDYMPVRLIEQREGRAEELSHMLAKTDVLHGDAREPATLLQAGLRDMDTVIAATKDNETNIMSSAMAHHLVRARSDGGNALRTIALVRKEEYLVLGSALGADIALNPKVLAGNAILKYIRRGKLLSVCHLHGCEAEVVELVADRGSPITRKPLSELGDVMKNRMIIGGYRRKDSWEIAVGGTQIEAGDKVIGICVSNDLPELERLFDR